MEKNKILIGDSLEILRKMESNSVDCVVTSPPYFGLRDYGVKGQLGLEKTPEEFIRNMVAVFSEVRRVLKKEGTLWLNIGDSYAGSGRGRDADGVWNPGKGGSKQETNKGAVSGRRVSEKSFSKKALEAGVIGNAWVKPPPGIKAKDLIGIPWMLAFALRTGGWYLRQDIIWAKPNPMPESVQDRCTKSHEYIFLLSKSSSYYYDHKAISEPLSDSSVSRLAQEIEAQKGSDRVPGKTNGTMKAVARKEFSSSMAGGGSNIVGHSGAMKPDGTPFEYALTGKRNKRSVWTVTTKPFKGAHFATFPEELIEPMILAGCPRGGGGVGPLFRRGDHRSRCKEAGAQLHRHRDQSGVREDGAETSRQHSE